MATFYQGASLMTRKKYQRQVKLKQRNSKPLTNFQPPFNKKPPISEYQDFPRSSKICKDRPLQVSLSFNNQFQKSLTFQENFRNCSKTLTFLQESSKEEWKKQESQFKDIKFNGEDLDFQIHLGRNFIYNGEKNKKISGENLRSRSSSPDFYVNYQHLLKNILLLQFPD
jgi:hypothetical protein